MADSLRDSKVDFLTTKIQDLHGRRLVNAGDAVGAKDYVTKQQLEKYTDKSLIASIALLVIKSITSFALRIISPVVDSVEAIQITKADKRTPILIIDSINKKVSIGSTSPDAQFEIDGEGRFRILNGTGTAPAAGKGLELVCISNVGYVLVYDRDGTAYLPLTLLGSDITVGDANSNIGFFGTTPAVQQTLNAYTTDSEAIAYTGLATGLGATPYASVTDLNALRVAYQNLRASYDDLRTKLQNTTLVA
jgi:hypothetical protein